MKKERTEIYMRKAFDDWARKEWPTCPPPAGAWPAWKAATKDRDNILRRALRRYLEPEIHGDDGWIEHNGTGDPRPANPWLEVRFGDGDVMVGRAYDWDQNWSWGAEDKDTPGIIVAYRRLAPRIVLRQKA